MVITQISAFFDSKVEQLKDPHVITMMESSSYNPNYEKFIANYSGVTETDTEEIIIMNIAKFNFGNSELASNVTIFNADDIRSIGALKLIEKLNTSSANDIFVPYSFKTNGGYKLGENFTIHYQEKDYDYRIAGFFETTMMGTTSIGIIKFMLPQNSFAVLADELDDVSKGIIISAVMEDKTQSTNLLNGFTKAFPQSTVSETNSYIWGLDVEMVKSVDTLHLLSCLFHSSSLSIVYQIVLKTG